MNYRHQYHAGNAADVFKHVLLRLVLAAMQRKEKGLLYLDTHAGRGGYELEATMLLPDGRTRAPEWPQGIGRLWATPGLTGALADYVAAVRTENAAHGAAPGELRHYPGSPAVARALLRPQDRAVLCELREDDAEALEYAFGRTPRAQVRCVDGYTAVRALLPPPERRGCVLLDPSFENPVEFTALLGTLREGRRRFPGGVYVVWYPVTERARSERFREEIRLLEAGPGETPVPALAVELQVAADSAPVRMKGCGVLVINPPWQVEAEIRAVLPPLVAALGLDVGAGARCDWVVPER